MSSNIFNSMILVVAVVIVFTVSYYRYSDLTVSLVFVFSTVTVLARMLKWNYEEWLSIEKLNILNQSIKSQNVTITGIGTANPSAFITTVENASQPKEIENYFNSKISEKESKHFIIDLSSSFILSIMFSLCAAVVALFIGEMNIKNTQTIDPAKVIYAFLPFIWQICSLLSPFLQIKRRNEKILTS